MRATYGSTRSSSTASPPDQFAKHRATAVASVSNCTTSRNWRSCTSGALDNTREFFKHDTFLVVNGKIITDIDLQAALETHRTNALATLVLPNPRRERFSVVETEAGRVTRFGGADPTAVGPSVGSAPLMFTGIHIMEPRIFEYIPRGVFSDSVTHVYPQAMANGEIIAAHVFRKVARADVETLSGHQSGNVA